MGWKKLKRIMKVHRGMVLFSVGAFLVSNIYTSKALFTGGQGRTCSGLLNS